MPRREALLADSALVVVTAIWGSTFVVNALVLKDTPPLLFLALRYGVAAVILVFFARGRPRTPGLVKDSAILGVLLAVGIGCQLVGQLFTTASKAAFVTGLSVPLTPVAGYLMTREPGTGSDAFRLFFMTGILGGFTTFSAFSLDVVVLWQRGAALAAIGYALSSVAVSILVLIAAMVAMKAMMAP